ncbi:MAG TPA: hypothetical protein VLE47_01630 [Candidatus Saccharimonadales bacterium]|nr:hypothetical protein [Candidatus Saccharimonadales bacterium]
MRPLTYIEEQLGVLGTLEQDRFGKSVAITLDIGKRKIRFPCSCPFYPRIKAMGCPLHHEGPGGSWPVEEAKVELEKIGEI